MLVGDSTVEVVATRSTADENLGCVSPLDHVPAQVLTCSMCVYRSAVTENTRASYPIHYIPNARIPCMGPHPKNLILLCCDAFGVLPPVSRLTKEQAMYYFISGYTAKVRPCAPLAIRAMME